VWDLWRRWKTRPGPAISAAVLRFLQVQVGQEIVSVNTRQNLPTEASPEVMGTTILPPDPFASSLTSLSHTSLSHTLAWAIPSPSSSTTMSCTRSSSPSARTDTQPRRRVFPRAKSSSRRRPRQKFSTSVYISGGLIVGSSGSPSHITTSVSKCNERMRKDNMRAEGVRTDVTVHEPTVRGSTDCAADTHKTVLLRANEQGRCRRVRLEYSDKRTLPSSSTGRRRTPGPLLLIVFVLTHTISSHLRNPHLARTSRPLSNPSPAPLPTHSRTKEGSADRAGMGKSCRSAHEKDEENGGSISMTSNLVC
jgi:hypothetical protein